MSKRFGFTLAEVLITLGIIGIVSAMTIPVLMQNIQNNEFKTKMRKEYSVLSEAYQLLKTENGGDFTGALASCVSDSDHACLRDIFKQKLSFIKECSTNSATNLGVCFPDNSVTKYLNGTYIGANVTYISNSVTSGLVLKDGTSLAFNLQSRACQKSTDSIGYTNQCAWITVDVNGINPPNTWGKDIYVFFIFSDAMRPCAPNTVGKIANDDCNAGSNTGYTCASKYLLGN